MYQNRPWCQISLEATQLYWGMDGLALEGAIIPLELVRTGWEWEL